MSEPDASEVSEGQAPEPIVLPTKANLDASEELVAKLREIGTAPGLTVDASGVETIGTPAILALISALKTREEMSPPVTIINPSTAFVDAFTDIGLFSDLMKMEFAS